MTNVNNKIFETSAILLMTFSFIGQAVAQTCEVAPSCESLGYTKSADDCTNKVTLKCPLDESKLYCADAKESGVCSSGYSEIEKIISYCTDNNARLIYDVQNPNCAKCQKCSSTSHFDQISGCCPDILYGKDVDGCANSTGYGTTTIYNIKGSDGCWTCSKCRNQYTLNADGLCVDPSIITGNACPAGYATYAEIIPYCSESETAKMVQHSTSKGCYKCKKCNTGYYFDNKCSGIGDTSDSNGCTRCKSCSAVYSVDATPIDGRCR